MDIVSIAMIYVFSVAGVALLFGIVKAIVDSVRKSDNSVPESVLSGFVSGLLIVGTVAAVVATIHLIWWIITVLSAL